MQEAPPQVAPQQTASNQTMRRIALVALVWSAAIALFGGLSWLSARVQTFGGTKPVSLLTNAPILVTGLLGCLVGAVFLALSKGLDRKLVLGVSIEIVSIGLVVCSLQRGITLFADRDYQPTYTPATKQYLSVPIFFPNGSERILPAEKRHLDDITAVYMSCKPSGVTIFGFASSAPFRVLKDKGCDSDCENAALARRRANAVSDYLKVAGVEATPYVWGSYEEMRGKSRLRDLDDAHKLRPREERLNRRVELGWTEASCFELEPNRK